ncbi:Asp/Glu racemase [Orrella marina]|uniref:Asp/Glu racemase n=2 Tax=Orrella marina TaxID=2163011 RepID=A0A2R4XJL3_9BURK|nr:Asp/Glu racemase [Orrella marina]
MLMRPIIFVINPNSTQSVTDAFDKALDPLRTTDGPEIQCLTLAEGPSGVERQIDVENVTLPLVRLVQKLESEHGERTGGFVIACFSDPGLYAVREATSRPVMGISESGILTAMTMGQRIGVIAILRGSIRRHGRMFGAMGVTDRVVAEEPLGMTVLELGDPQRTREGLKRAGQKLRDEYLVDVLVLGCAGMADHRDWLQQELDMPVVEPTQAATAMAMGRALLRW